MYSQIFDSGHPPSIALEPDEPFTAAFSDHSTSQAIFLVVWYPQPFHKIGYFIGNKSSVLIIANSELINIWTLSGPELAISIFYIRFKKKLFFFVKELTNLTIFKIV